jgi:hypothetical protein
MGKPTRRTKSESARPANSERKDKQELCCINCSKKTSLIDLKQDLLAEELYVQDNLKPVSSGFFMQPMKPLTSVCFIFREKVSMPAPHVLSMQV